MHGLKATVLVLAAAVSAQAAEKPTKYSNVNPKDKPQAASQSARPPKVAHSPNGSLTFYTDRPTFDAAHPGIPLETFVNTNIPPNSVLACPGPFDSNTN